MALICAFFTSIIFLGRALPQVPFLFSPWSGEQTFEDKLRVDGRKTATRDDFVFVGIDQASLQLDSIGPEEIAQNRALQLMTERPFPWSREVWALLLDRLFESGARLVVFDMIFNLPNDGDPALASALEKYKDRVVVGGNFDIRNNERTGATEHQFVVPNSALIHPPAERDDRVGFVNFWPDPDEQTRHVRYARTVNQLANREPGPGEEMFYSLSARALMKLGRGGDLPQDPMPHAIRFTSPDAFPPLPLYEIFLPATWRANFAEGVFFKDKVVIVGASAQVMHDVVSTPVSPSLPGPALHLHAMAAAISHEFLHSTPPAVAFTLVGAGGACAWLLIAFVRRPIVSLLALIGIAVLYVLLARVLYDTRGFFLITAPVLTAFLLSGLFSLGYEYALERLEKLRTRRTLERYVSKNLVKEILDSPDSFYNTLKGVRKPATMLFSDIVGFTSMTETADPEKLVAQLNEYLTRMVAVVFEHEGTLDKFIGDAVMAVWGMARSVGVEADAKMAARAALAMRRELVALNEKWRAEGFPPLSTGIGLNHGEVLAGNIGSSERADLTVIGDAVNLASRLEALTRTYHVDILIGGSVADLVRDEFHIRSVGRVQVKGKSKPAEICTIIAARDAKDADADLLRWLDTYEQGIAKFRDRNFVEAKILFSRFLEFYPDDFLAKTYLDRTLEYEQVPPNEAWNAVEVFTKK